MCGGTINARKYIPTSRGLSPRVRGNPGSAGAHGALRRSIPACAGEPRRTGASSTPWRVYPRVCGGTAAHLAAVHRPRGLSPRVRGNPRWVCRSNTTIGSIPACAGEPARPRRGWCSTRVYPRVCGGTALRGLLDVCLRGLSPRVRGNLLGPWTVIDEEGSIPACAGEPAAQSLAGGQREGLSPRVRGNLPAPPKCA